jgi:DNA/RNA endonuclease G (NUC1)
MTAKADFVYGSHMRATFWFLNVAPQWQTFNGGNWNNMEMSTRSFAGGYDNNLDVYTGTHGVTTLADVNGNEVPIYIAYDANNNGILRVPALYWRVVFDPTTGNVSIKLKKSLIRV